MHEFKYEIHMNSREFVQIRMNFLHEKLVMLRMACTVLKSNLIAIQVRNQNLAKDSRLCKVSSSTPAQNSHKTC